MPCVRYARYCSWGSPSSSSPWLRAGVARCLVQVNSSLPCPHVRYARCSSGGSPLSSSSWLHAGVARGLVGVDPLLPCPRAVCARYWVGVPPSSSIPLPRAWGTHCRVWGPPPTPLGEGSLPPSPPWWPHTLSACDRSGGLRSLLLSYCMPQDRSVSFPVSSPVSVSARLPSVIPLMAQWPAPLT